MEQRIANSKWNELLSFPRNVEMKYLHVFGSSSKDTLGALFITADDKVFGIGHNGGWCLLGLPNSSTQYREKVQVVELSCQGVICISVGLTVGAAITADGRIFLWGRRVNDSGVTGISKVHQPHESLLHHFVSVACGAMFVVALTDQGSAIMWGLLAQGAAEVSGHSIIQGPSISAISCGMYHIAMLTDLGEVHTCGLGSNGQLGRTWSRRERYLGTQPVEFVHECNTVIQVACGSWSTLFLMENGSLLATGTSDINGYLGVETDEEYRHIIRYPELVSIDEPVESIAATIFSPSIYAALTDYGEVWTWGSSMFPRKLGGQRRLIGAFYGAAIPPLLGDVIHTPKSSVRQSTNAVAAATHPPAKKKVTGDRTDRKYLELADIMKDLTILHNEVGNIIGTLAPLLDRETTSNSTKTTLQKRTR